MKEITYTTIGDYQFPNITAKKEKPCEMKKYSVMRLEFLKTKQRGLYITLLTSLELSEHLTSIQNEAEKMLDTLITEMAKREDVTEELKKTDQLAWVGAMNNIQSRAEEIVIREVVEK